MPIYFRGKEVDEIIDSELLSDDSCKHTVKFVDGTTEVIHEDEFNAFKTENKEESGTPKHNGKAILDSAYKLTKNTLDVIMRLNPRWVDVRKLLNEPIAKFNDIDNSIRCHVLGEKYQNDTMTLKDLEQIIKDSGKEVDYAGIEDMHKRMFDLFVGSDFTLREVCGISPIFQPLVEYIIGQAIEVKTGKSFHEIRVSDLIPLLQEYESGQSTSNDAVLGEDHESTKPADTDVENKDGQLEGDGLGDGGSVSEGGEQTADTTESATERVE